MRLIFLYQVEVLSAKPEVVIIHEVLTDHEIQQIKLKAISKLQVHSLTTLTVLSAISGIFLTVRHTFGNLAQTQCVMLIQNQDSGTQGYIGAHILGWEYTVKKGSRVSRLHTVLKMGLILRSIQRRPQMQFSMGHKFTLWRHADMT
jgi:hypothetical protein